MEVGIECKDCRQIVRLLEQTLELSPGVVPPLDRRQQPALTHRFRNLDGGAEAAFLISREREHVQLTVERSDESDFAFRISLEDARKLLNTLERALVLAVGLSP